MKLDNLQGAVNLYVGVANGVPSPQSWLNVDKTLGAI